MRFKHWKTHAMVTLSLALLTTALAPATLAEQNRLRVDIQEPFVVNGHVYQASQLTVKEVGRYSPHSVFAEVWVGNECLGQMIAREQTGGALAANDSVVFSRNSAGTLVLVGLDFRGQPTRMLDVAFRSDVLTADVGTSADETEGATLVTALPR